MENIKVKRMEYDVRSGRCLFCNAETLWGDAPHADSCLAVEMHRAYLVRQRRVEYWNHFIEKFFVDGVGRRTGVTGPRLRRVKEAVLADDEFWFNVIDMHNGQHRTPEQMETDTPEDYSHCQGNFWDMLRTIIDGHKT